MTVDVLLFTDFVSNTFVRTSGAYTIASVLRDAGLTVKVVDHFLFLGPKKTESVLEKYVGSNTLFVGFSSTFMNISKFHVVDSSNDKSMFDFNHLYGSVFYNVINTSIDVFPITDAEFMNIKNKIKNINPKTQLVFGGAKASYIKNSIFDVFILGYAEAEVLDYIKYLTDDTFRINVKYNEFNQIIIDHDIDASKFNFIESKVSYRCDDYITEKETLTLEISRGCIFKCKFCAYRLNGKKTNDYIKTPEALYSELMDNYEKYGVTSYTFADDTLNESVEKLEMLASVTRRLPFSIDMATYLRHDLIYTHREMADLLREIGLRVAIFGIETLNHESGKAIGKGLHPERTKELLYWLRDDKGWKNNIMMNSGFIFGLPHDTPETCRQWGNEVLADDYPLDWATFSSLSIMRNINRLQKSEFDLNYQKYGYYFDNDRTHVWKNSSWSQQEAFKLAIEYYNKFHNSKRAKIRGMKSITLKYHGYTWPEIFSKSSADIDDYFVFKQTKERAIQYHNKILNENTI